MAGEEPRETDVTGGTGEVETDSGYAPHDWGASDNTPGLAQYNNISSAAGDAFAGDAGAITQVAANIVDLGSNVGGLLLDPVGWVIEAGLAFLIDFIQPLEDLVGLATGNSERMLHEIEKWNSVRDAMGPLSQEVREIADATLQSWSGDASSVAKTRIHELADAIDNIDAAMNQLVITLDLARALAEALMAALKTIIAEFLKPVVYAWISAIAAAGPTFGASTAAAASYTAVQYSFSIVRAGQRIQQGTSIGAKILQICIKINNVVGSHGYQLVAFANFAPPLISDMQDAASGPENEMSDEEITNATQ